MEGLSPEVFEKLKGRGANFERRKRAVETAGVWSPSSCLRTRVSITSTYLFFVEGLFGFGEGFAFFSQVLEDFDRVLAVSDSHYWSMEKQRSSSPKRLRLGQKEVASW